MRRLAGVFLGSGLFIIALVFYLALDTIGDNEALASPLPAITDNCLFCHDGVHTTWQMVTPLPPRSHLEAQMPTPDYTSDNAQLCSDCHTIDNQFQLPDHEIRQQIENVKARVEQLEAVLGSLFEEHPEWDSGSQRQDKPQAQIIAERISTLVGVVEADGSWGFHDPAYTNGILSEAESLLTLLLEYD